MVPMKAIVYIDGFNLYYGCVKDTPYKWLNLEEFCRQMVPADDVIEIKYFTALVKPRPDNPGAAQRQQVFLRALRTLPMVRVYYGHFIRSQVRMALVNPSPGRKTALVFKTEEKGSDVNLATELLVDGFNRRYELAVVVSNDGDLKGPVEHVRGQFGMPVGVLNPHPHRSWALSPRSLPNGSFYRRIRPHLLAASQFPQVMTDETGEFHKPQGW
jgi:hypothetical protein